MSKMAELALDIEELLNEDISPKMIAATLGIDVQTVYELIEELECLELEKQSEMLSYADEMANNDAQYYGD